MKYAIIILSLALIASATYAFTIDTDPQIIIEKKNREAILQCMENVQSSTWTARVLQEQIKQCTKIELQTITNAKATTGSVIPVPEHKWYTAKHELILSGSHDYRIYSDRKGAVWKNNNPSWITWWVSDTLKSLWKERWIHFEKWTPRPANEWWNYILFLTIEDGLRAKVVSIRERWGNATVSHFLAGWGTDYVKISFDTSKKIKNLSDEEFAELFIQQLKKESPGLVNQLVKDWILVVK